MTLDDALLRIGENIITDAKTALKKQGHIATGSLYNSMKAKVEASQLSFELTSYAKYVDEGRKPGKYAPVQSIKDWCKVKGINTNLSYVINRKIKEKGIKPSLFFTIAYEKNLETMDDMIDAYMDDLFDDMMQ